jgi:hypothetical protein
MLFRCVAVAVSLLASRAAPAPAAHFYKVSSVLTDETTLTVNVPIDLVGASEEVAARWRAGIERYWNRGNDGRPFAACRRSIHFRAQFRRRVWAPQSSTSHLVLVERVRPGERFVSTVWHTLGTSPAYSPRTGYWGSTMDGAMAAHEFGHLLGLVDEYIEADANANGFRDAGERPVPDASRLADAPFSLMATDRGSVLRRHIDEILRMHDAAAPTCESKN